MVIAIKVVRQGAHITPKDSGYRESGRKEPDERDVDGVWPWAWHRALLAREVPLAVLHKEMPRQEQEGQGQEEEEAVIKVAVADTVGIPIVPSQIDHLEYIKKYK